MATSGQSGDSRFLVLIGDNPQPLLRICRVNAWSAADREDLESALKEVPKFLEPAQPLHTGEPHP